MKLGIAGTGLIVTHALDALCDVPEIEVTALYARPQSVEKAKKLTEEYITQRGNSPSVTTETVEIYTDYEKFLQESGCSCIYIGLTNSVHFSFTRRALEAGKHVILEKPSVMRAEKLDELIACARNNGVLLLEAFTTWHSEIFQKMQQLLPEIGRVRLAAGSYTQYSSRYNAYLKQEVLPAFDPARGGGCLYDITIYGLSLLAAFFGETAKIRYSANLGFNGADTSGIVSADYPDLTAVVSGAKDADGPGYFFVTGEKGWIRANGPLNVLKSLDYKVNGQEAHYEPEPDRHRMIREFRDFERVVRENDVAAAEEWLSWSRATIRMADAARIDAGLVVCADDESMPV